jgi:hypothetical protein
MSDEIQALAALSLGKGLQYLLVRKLRGPQSQSGRCHCRESNPSGPIHVQSRNDLPNSM